jgi:hypothetical protein
MSRPRLRDLCCGPGGAGMGYHRAGFDVDGVDIDPQPRYPFEFTLADALTVPLDGDWDAIHASPPCQAYCGATAWRGDRANHPDLIAPIRDRLIATGLPYVIETVQDGRRHLHNPVKLCGSMFGIPVRRHRYFEVSGFELPVLTLSCRHVGLKSFDHGFTCSESDYRTAMGCDWMQAQEAREAIPPAFTEWIGTHLMAALNERAAA